MDGAPENMSAECKRSAVAFCLQPEQPRIVAILCHQTVMVAALDHFTVVNDEDLVGGPHRGETVRDKNGHLVVAVLAKIGIYRSLGSGIHGRGGLIKD